MTVSERSYHTPTAVEISKKSISSKREMRKLYVSVMKLDFQMPDEKLTTRAFEQFFNDISNLVNFHFLFNLRRSPKIANINIIIAKRLPQHRPITFRRYLETQWL